MPAVFRLHTPTPSHTLPTALFPVQVFAPAVTEQSVPDAQSRHLPAPSHWPSWVQAVFASALHSLSGSVPDTIASQWPSTPCPFFVSVHAWHVPLHAVSQHTPSAQ
jgi:hypothetical protein